jgi:hypothetical protein
LEKFKVIIWNSQQGFEGDRIVRPGLAAFFAEADVPGPAGGGLILRQKPTFLFMKMPCKNIK